MKGECHGKTALTPLPVANACFVFSRPAQEDDKPLEQVSAAFLRTFTKNDHFKVGCTICILLQDNLLTSSQVRLLLRRIIIAHL